MPVASVRSRESFVVFWWVFGVSLAINLAFVEIVNDHFDRISRGHQILRFGAVPFRDFFDPGWLLTIYSSAAVQAIFGHRLVGEVILTGVLIAAGTAFAAVLVRAATGSSLTAAAAALLLVVSQPRAYDYDKVFFYAFGLFMCWSYIERPAPKAAVFLGITTVIAGLYRYDNGIYVAAAALVTLVTIHWPDAQLLGRRALLFVAACVTACAPPALFIATHGSISDAVRQIVAYARVEGVRTGVFGWPRPAMDWTAPLATLERNAEPFLYYLLMGLPILAVGSLLWRRRAGRPAERTVVARGLSAAALSALAGLFVLRDPIRARYAAVAVSGVVVAGWLLRDAIRPVAEGAGNRVARFCAAALAVAATVAMIVVGEWPERLEPLLTRADDESRLARLWDERRQQWESVAGPMRDDEWISGYLRRCTAPTDRILVVDFQPQLPVYAERGFAGGMLVFLGFHWSSPDDQQRIVQRLKNESVPIVISRIPDSLHRWPIVSAYVEREYTLAGASAFGRNADEQFSVLIKRDAGRKISPDPLWHLPCFAEGAG